MPMFNELDALLHSQARLAIISILMGVEEAEFVYLKENTNLSAGNLSLQLEKLKVHKYITVTKGYKNNYPVTTCRITKNGIKSFETYVENLKQYIEYNREERTKKKKRSSQSA